MLRRKAIFAFGLAGVVTALCLPVANAQEEMHDAATPEQQLTQEEVVERAKALVDRFTNRLSEQPTETTGLPMEEAPVEAQSEVFDPGPVETFTDTQHLEEPVDYLPDSGLGISVTGLALGLTTLRHHKRLAKHAQKLRKLYS